MGSRLRENVKQLFECFCEVAEPVGERQAWILQKYPNSFVDEEILKSVPKFAYPCKVENLLVQHFSFVLTSIDSKWTFGFCRHDPKTETALVVLSALPWHETFYKFLNHIASLTSSGENLWKFLESVYDSDVPIPGNTVSIPLPNSNAHFVCQSPKQFQLPSIPENRNLTEYYSAVDAHNMMTVFASMLYERRIIFTSKRLSRLSACVQACNALIYPMIWQHIYIPVLPLSLMDYLLAPMPFLIGVPAATLQRAHKSDLGEVVILDADNNTVESPFQDLESLPQDVVANLKKALRNRPALLGDGVSRAFLRALVQLTAGYREALTLQQGERITFDENAFVESRPSSMQPFLRKMLELQIFQQFIEERLNMLNSGLGFSDEFEMEACSYSVKSSSKFMQQYREWTYTMRKESSAFFRSVKDKANPAVKYAVKSVKDKGKDMKTAYKGLKWKGRGASNRGGETGMRFHQPRSAPSSPTLDRRRPIGFTPPPKSPNGFAAPTTTYRKELRMRNSNFADSSRKQYSPLGPSSPDELESSPERINIDLMHELRDVIFPSTPPVDRTLKPVRSLDSLRPAWSGHTRHGPPPPSTVVANPRDVPLTQETLSVAPRPSSDRIAPPDYSLLDNSPPTSLPSPDVSANPSVNLPANQSAGHPGTSRRFASSSSAVQGANRERKEADRAALIPVPAPSTAHQDQSDRSRITETRFKSYVENAAGFYGRSGLPSASVLHAWGDSFGKCLTVADSFSQENDAEEDSDDPFDTSKAFVPSYLHKPIMRSVNLPLPVQPRTASLPLNATSCSARVKDSPSEVSDLIRLDSTNSTDDDFDPLLSKPSSGVGGSKQMSQSLHMPDMGEGLSNPLYPYFQPPRRSDDKQQHQQQCKPSNSSADLDLLQAYGLDFDKFGIANGESVAVASSSGSSSARRFDQSLLTESSISGISSIDNSFGLSLNAPTPPVVKSQSNWTKFD